MRLEHQLLQVAGRQVVMGEEGGDLWILRRRGVAGGYGSGSDPLRVDLMAGCLTQASASGPSNSAIPRSARLGRKTV